MLGNSLPLRDVDAYVSDCADVVILSQRGANGIDGLVSGAAGSALGAAAPTLLLLGDVSLLHDLAGLDAVARSLRTPLVLAVIDNDGGRIFDQLPVHALYETEPRLAHPSGAPLPEFDLRIRHALFGLHYSAPTTETELSRRPRSVAAQLGHAAARARGADSARTCASACWTRLAAVARGGVALELAHAARLHRVAGEFRAAATWVPPSAVAPAARRTSR
jgi:hypothetical protein